MSWEFLEGWLLQESGGHAGGPLGADAAPRRNGGRASESGSAERGGSRVLVRDPVGVGNPRASRRQRSRPRAVRGLLGVGCRHASSVDHGGPWSYRGERRWEPSHTPGRDGRALCGCYRRERTFRVAADSVDLRRRSPTWTITREQVSARAGGRRGSAIARLVRRRARPASRIEGGAMPHIAFTLSTPVFTRLTHRCACARAHARPQRRSLQRPASYAAQMCASSVGGLRVLGWGSDRPVCDLRATPLLGV